MSSFSKYAHAPAAIEQAVPISAWQPHSAPLIDALVLTTFPIIPAIANALIILSSEILYSFFI